MSNPNPLIPQGSVFEQQAKSRPHLRIALCIVAAHLVFLGLLLMQGCKKEDPSLTQSNGLPPLDTNAPAFGSADTNFPPLGVGLGQPVGGATGGGYSNLPPVGGVASNPGGLPPFGGPAQAGAQQTLTQGAPAYAEPEPAPAPVASGTDYTVQKNDSFYSIGRKFKVSPTAIAKANPGVDSTKLRIGQKLHIPAASVVAPPAAAAPAAAVGTGLATGSAAGDTYVVKSGDTLMKIARQHGTTHTVLMELNGLKTARINVGQKLRLPAKAAPPAVAPDPFPAAVPEAAPAGPATSGTPTRL